MKFYNYFLLLYIICLRVNLNYNVILLKEKMILTILLVMIMHNPKQKRELNLL